MHKLSLRIMFLLAMSLFSLSMQGQVSPPKRAYLEYIITPDHPDREYSINERARLRVEAYEGGVPKDGTYVYYKVGDEMMLPPKYDSIPFRNGCAMIDMGTMTTSGFRAADIYFISAEGKKIQDLVKVAFAPDQIRTYATMPEDFRKFWDNTLRQMSKIPMNAEVTVLPAKSTPKVEVSLVKLTVGKNGRAIYGYLAKPKDGKKHPVLFNPPGAGTHRINAITEYAEEWGYLTFVIEIHGNNPESPDNVFDIMKNANTSYNTMGIGSKETFYYRDVYAGCVRSIDFLCTLEEWDGKNVHVTGGSQGGALSIITTALHPKVTAVAAFYPALCDLKGFAKGRAGGWPRYFSGSSQMKNILPDERTMNTLDYYDVVNFARIITQPGFYSWGWNDNTCSPTSLHAMYGEIIAPKMRDITPTSGHWRFPSSNRASLEWLRQQMR